jgi:hypothetical protein
MKHNFFFKRGHSTDTKQPITNFNYTFKNFNKRKSRDSSPTGSIGTRKEVATNYCHGFVRRAISGSKPRELMHKNIKKVGERFLIISK